jgi:hypothetical protein
MEFVMGNYICLIATTKDLMNGRKIWCLSTGLAREPKHPTTEDEIIHVDEMERADN